ncbi:MAG: NAD-dependent malic enzyme [Christensenellaceae bacterium]|jgi:malate dehydrogenase (oxaloacetate-decarboxylating)|nr:NAD-dependent malic enzyme [Christensenellaceae bacterium]
MDYAKEALARHAAARGKIRVESKLPLENQDDLAVAYTPGVAEPCREIHKDKAKVYTYTAKGNLVAVVSDGSAVLGLGNIGAEASIPVMEGKAVLFRRFAGVDAFPICLNTQDVDEIVETVARLEPVFGGINLEDISAPRCFLVEDRLKERLSIPVFHDDQHGTAIIVAAGLLNALKVVGKSLATASIVVNGIGAAGSAICILLEKLGAKAIIPCDINGILNVGEEKSHFMKDALAARHNPRGRKGSLADALRGADVFIGVSAPNIVSPEMVSAMNPDSIIFAMANPTPEIMPDLAKKAGVRVMGTGRSDFPNQVNNCLAFPGLFRGALDSGAREINDEMKFAAVQALSSLVAGEDLSEDHILPAALDPRVAPAVAKAVAEAAISSGAAPAGQTA